MTTARIPTTPSEIGFSLVLAGFAVVAAPGCGTKVESTPTGVAPEPEKQDPNYAKTENASRK